MKVLNAKGKNIYIITLIGKEGFVRSQLILGTINKKQFFLILSKIFNQILTTRRSQAKFLVMDNCFLHGKQDVIEFAEHNNFDVIFLPPYSPQLNPVELYFHELKSAIRK
jgi:transposase